MSQLTQKKKLRIAVLMGGVSNEREVSLESGRAVAEALGRCGHVVTGIDIKRRNIDAVVQTNPDVAFIAMHGEFGEDGQVQDMLEGAGIPYTGSEARASRTGMDKKASKKACLRAAVPTAPYTITRATTAPADILRQAEVIGFPLVCKPTMGGSSIGVSMLRSRRDLEQVAESWKAPPACAAAGGTLEMMLEKYIPGRELTVGVLDGKPLPVVEIVSPGDFFDYRAKYRDENTSYHVPVPLIESVYRKVCDAAVRTYRAIGCRHMARVDIIYGCDGGIYVLELNTIPGMTARSLLPLAARYDGVELPELCERLCLWAWTEAAGRGRRAPDVLRKTG